MIVPRVAERDDSSVTRRGGRLPGPQAVLYETATPYARTIIDCPFPVPVPVPVPAPTRKHVTFC